MLGTIISKNLTALTNEVHFFKEIFHTADIFQKQMA